MLIGYMRVSSSDERQSVALQRDALLAAGVDERHLHQDRASGARDDRPGLKACLGELREGDVYLLCTDGLNDLVSDADIGIIIDALKTNLPLTATHLIQLANDSGGYDNITVALLHVRKATAQSEGSGWLSRVFGRLLN